MNIWNMKNNKNKLIKMTDKILIDKSEYVNLIFNKAIFSDIQQAIADGDVVTIPKSEYENLKDYAQRDLQAEKEMTLSDEFRHQQVKAIYNLCHKQD